MSKRQRKHNHVVSSVLAAALAFTAIVSSVQLASVSDDLAANVSGRYVAVDPATCPPQGMSYDAATDSCVAGGGTPPAGDGGGANIICPNGSSHPSPYTCTPQENCAAPQTWDGTSCTAGGTPAGDGGSTIPAGTCPDGYAYPAGSYPNGACVGHETSAGGTASSYGTEATCRSANFYWYNNVCNSAVQTVGSCTSSQYWDAATSTCKTSAPAGGTASSYVTEPTCVSANFYWYNSRCNSTGAGTSNTAPYPAGTCSDGTSYPAGTGTPPCGTTPTPTVGSCTNGQYWDAATSTCKASTQVNQCGQGQYWNGTSCVNTSPSDTAGCTQDQITKLGQGCHTMDSGYFNGEMTKYIPYSGTTVKDCTTSPVQGCTSGSTMQPYAPAGAAATACGYNQYWDQNTNSCVPFPTPVQGFVGKDPASYGKTGDETGCWNAGYYWKMFPDGRGDCFPDQYSAPVDKSAIFTDDFYNQFSKEDYECPPWDAWCQKNKDMGTMGQNDQWAQWETAECLSEKDASKQRKQIEQQIVDLEHGFNSIDLENATDLSVVANSKQVLDKLQGLDLGDNCQIGQAWAALENVNGEDGLWRELDKQRELVEFRKALSRIKQDIQMFESKIQGERPKELLGKASAKITELEETPPYNPEEPWKIWETLEPECMRFGGPMPMAMGFPGGGETGGMFPGGGATGGQFPGGKKGGQQFGCTIDDLIESDTPRGYFEAAMRMGEEERRANFSNNMCKDAKMHLKGFVDNILPQMSGSAAAEGEQLIEDAKITITACEKATDKSQFANALQKLGMRAEKLMSTAGIDFEGMEGPSFDARRFSGLGNLTDEDLMAKIDAIIAERVEAAVGKILSEFERRMTVVFEEKFTQLAMNIASDVLDGLTAHIGKVTEEVGEGVLATLDYAASFDPEKRSDNLDAYEAKADITNETFDALDAVVALDDNTEKKVEDLQELISDPIVPPSVLENVQTFVERAETVAKNGGDAEAELEKAIDYVESFDKVELRDLAYEEGIVPMSDLDISTDNSVWFKDYAMEAYGKGVIDGGTNPETGEKELQAERTLNMTEGSAMIVKAADLEVTAGIASAEVISLVGRDVHESWKGGDSSKPGAADYVQALVDEVGFDKVKEGFAANGGAGGSMDRSTFAELSIGTYESAVGRQDVEVSDTIGGYEDLAKLDNEGRHNFSVAFDLGMITGADGGRFANPDSDTNRAEGAKMLSALKDAMAETSLTAGFSGTSMSNTDFFADVEDDGTSIIDPIYSPTTGTGDTSIGSGDGN